MQNYIVTIGRNYGKKHPTPGVEMPPAEWADFLTDVRRALDFNLGAENSRLETHHGVGEWEGTFEESAVITLLDAKSVWELTSAEWDLFLKEISRLCDVYYQDAIAVAETEPLLVS